MFHIACTFKSISILKKNRHACYYCGPGTKLLSKCLRHINAIHWKESEVIKMNLMKREERLLVQEKIRNLGDYLHNLDVIERGYGELLVKISSKNHNAAKYIPCDSCFAFHLISQIGRHNMICRWRNKKNLEFRSINNKALLYVVFKPLSDKDFIKTVLEKMKPNEITKASQKDSLIVKACHSKFKLGITGERIRKDMRLMGQILLQLRKNTCTTKPFRQFLTVENFNNIIEATKQLCISATQTVHNPRLALHMGALIRLCAAVKLGEAIRDHDKMIAAEVQKYIELHSTEWKNRVCSAISIRLRMENQISKLSILQFTLKYLKIFLCQKCK